MCVVTKSLRKREDAPAVYLAVAWMQLCVALSQGFRKQAFISGKWKQKPHFEENGEPRQNGKQGTFVFWGTGEQVNLFQGNRYSPGRASYIKHLTRQKGVCVRS